MKRENYTGGYTKKEAGKTHTAMMIATYILFAILSLGGCGCTFIHGTFTSPITTDFSFTSAAGKGVLLVGYEYYLSKGPFVEARPSVPYLKEASELGRPMVWWYAKDGVPYYKKAANTLVFPDMKHIGAFALPPGIYYLDVSRAIRTCRVGGSLYPEYYGNLFAQNVVLKAVVEAGKVTNAGCALVESTGEFQVKSQWEPGGISYWLKYDFEVSVREFRDTELAWIALLYPNLVNYPILEQKMIYMPELSVK